MLETCLFIHSLIDNGIGYLEHPCSDDLPKHNPGCRSDIQRMFHAQLGYLNATITLLNGLLLDTGHFIAKNDRNFFILFKL